MLAETEREIGAHAPEEPDGQGNDPVNPELVRHPLGPRAPEGKNVAVGARMGEGESGRHTR